MEVHPELQAYGSTYPDLDPTDDPDLDGVLTVEELAYDLNPSLAQTTIGIDDWNTFETLYFMEFGHTPPRGDYGDVDGDGVPDGWEYFYGLDWRNALDALEDPDNDGLDNLDEYYHGTDPFLADTDGDGEDDSQETAQGSDPNDPASTWAILDTDGDGISNAQEVLNGTDPYDPEGPLLMGGDIDLREFETHAGQDMPLTGMRVSCLSALSDDSLAHAWLVPILRERILYIQANAPQMSEDEASAIRFEMGKYKAIW